MSGFGNPFDRPVTKGLFGALGAPPKQDESGFGRIASLLAAPPPSPPDPTVNALATILGSLEPPRKGFGTILGGLEPAPRSALAGAYNALNVSTSALAPPPTILSSLSVAPSVRRKVFFSFYFEGDIRRSCIVRNSYRFRPGRKLPSANFHDKSLWESSRRESEESLKRLIRNGMAGSSVTCVLAGTYTWERPWVRFEIAHSLFRGNGLFTVFIHNVNDARLGRADPGPNPLDFMGLQLRPDGRGNVCEWVGSNWRLFSQMQRPVPWPSWLPKPSVNYAVPLGRSTRAYDYCLDDGYNHLAAWTQEAARAARR